MKISLFKYDLLGSINIAMRAVPTRTTLPILESFLIDATGGEIKIITNDNDMGIETKVEGIIETPGKVAIDAKIFGEIIRKLSDNVIIIETDANNKVKINCENSEFNLAGRDANEFPELPEAEEENKITVSQFTLKEIIRKTIFSIAQGEVNAIMKGELFEINKDILKIVSLDGHRISIRKEALEGEFGEEKVIVPGKTLNEISRILSGEKDEKVEIIFDKKFIKFIFEKTKVVSRLIEGEYFDVERMISTDYSSVITINRAALLDEIERAFTLSKEGEKKPIIMEITGNDLFLELNSSLGTMYGRVDIQKEGGDLVIGFNPRYFIEALKVIEEEEINIFFASSNAPCIIKNDDESYKYIILPVNINR